MLLSEYIRDIKDFPKKGIIYKDISPLLKNPDAFKFTIDSFSKKIKDFNFDYIVGIESRGFIFAAALSLHLNKGLIPIRKKGKLPAETVSIDYELEYGTDTLEIHKDSLPSNSKVIVVDDLLATGGTISACEKLIKKINCEVIADLFVIQLSFLDGIKNLTAPNIIKLIEY
jgi:adenine phosphoribosyltransferase